jgi:hypothetical protein
MAIMRFLKTTYKIVIVICLLFGIHTPTEAVDPNPFELVYRLDDSAKIAINSPRGNPFEIASPALSLQKEQEEAARYDEDVLVQISRYEGDRAVSKNWLLFMIIPLLLILTLVASLFRDKLNALFKSFTNGNIQNMAYRESIGRANVHSFLLYIVSIMSFGLFGLVLFINSHINTENLFKALVVSQVLSASYLLTKYFGIYFVRTVFPHKKIMDMYLFMFGQYNHILGIALIPFTVFLAFAPIEAVTIIKYTTFFFIGFWWIMRMLRGLQIGSKFMSMNIFRFFAYLCAVEIAPVLILLTTLKLILSI